MNPRRTIAPEGALVDLADLKAHVRVDSSEDDALIQALEKAAVAHLDGWRGVLGRCILPQTWEVNYPAAGIYRLPFPDVVSVAVTTGTASLAHDSLGSRVDLSAGGTVTLVAAMPEDALDQVRLIVKLLVGHWYENREATTALALKSAPMAVEALLSPIRWNRI